MNITSKTDASGAAKAAVRGCYAGTKLLVKCMVCCVVPGQPQFLKARHSRGVNSVNYFQLHVLSGQFPTDPELYEAFELCWSSYLKKKKVVRTKNKNALTDLIFEQTVFNKSFEVVRHSTHIRLAELIFLLVVIFIAIKDVRY